jgi:hypothetical protein
MPFQALGNRGRTPSPKNTPSERQSGPAPETFCGSTTRRHETCAKDPMQMPPSPSRRRHLLGPRLGHGHHGVSICIHLRGIRCRRSRVASLQRDPIIVRLAAPRRHPSEGTSRGLAASLLGFSRGVADDVRDPCGSSPCCIRPGGIAIGSDRRTTLIRLCLARTLSSHGSTRSPHAPTSNAAHEPVPVQPFGARRQATHTDNFQFRSR